MSYMESFDKQNVERLRHQSVLHVEFVISSRAITFLRLYVCILSICDPWNLDSLILCFLIQNLI